MITNISKLKGFGVFHDFKAGKELKPFAQYNIFYGWNGSGKSTLTKVFLSITDKKMHVDFLDGEFTVSIKDLPDITHKNIAQNDRNIRVFNKDFIERNVNFEQSKANSILILSQEKKEEMEKYKSLAADVKAKESAFKIDKEKYEKSVDALKKDLSRWASNVKKSFELIETANTYYLNYDRTKLNQFIINQRNKISSAAILSQDEVKNLKNAIKPSQKPDIDITLFTLFNGKAIINLLEEIEKLLRRSILSKQIARLTLNPEINLWVNQGLSIHEKYNSSNCEFCGQVISSDRFEELNKHFSKEYDDLLRAIDKNESEVESLVEMVNNAIPDTGELYDELYSVYDDARNRISSSRTKCLSKFKEIFRELSEKEMKPFSIIECKFEEVDKVLIDYNEDLNNVFKIIAKHNFKNKGFDEAVKTAQSKLELHFVSEILIAESYEKTEFDIQAQKNELGLKEQEIRELNSQLTELEVVLLNEAIGAEEFNKNLSKFLGRKDISLEFDRSAKGYKLIRKGKAQPAKNLSEGERTAIAFVYFISKLRENGNKIEKTIVVLDDPISSFDSNHLFHSYSYLKQECEKAEQLFILTHNFQYFKLIRDWLMKKNEKKIKDGIPYEKIRTNCYSIECTVEEERKASIHNANSTLLDFNSEYHYIFYKLLSFKDNIQVDLEKAFLIANLSRKLLESFLTFKFPKGRKDFSQLLQAGCPDSAMRDKIYRFINKYSHNQLIDFNDGPIDNLLGEGKSIIEAVLKVVEDLDNDHYSEMIELCN